MKEKLIFLSREILTSMRTNENIHNKIRKLVWKQCFLILREINNNKNIIENSITSINNSGRKMKNNTSYLWKYKNLNSSKNKNSIPLRNSSLEIFLIIIFIPLRIVH